LVTQPSLPGTENLCLSAFVADWADTMPTRVSTNQNTTTMRLCASTQRVSDVIACSFPRQHRGVSIASQHNDSVQNDLYHKSFRAVMILI
jgi:hypothetical protein